MTAPIIEVIGDAEPSDAAIAALTRLLLAAADQESQTLDSVEGELAIDEKQTA